MNFRGLHFHHLKDKNFHRLLFITIAILGSINIYYTYNYVVYDPLREDFNKNIGKKYNLELDLQKKEEEVKTGSIKIPILIYHSVRDHINGEDNMLKYYTVSPESFTKQMQYLKDNNYSVLSLDFIADALEENIPVPEKSVAITFDDGWRNQYVNAYPILRRFGYTATFFIITNTIDKPHFFSWDQVRLMNNNGMTIGSHTVFHPFLPEIENPKELQKELVNSKKVIEEKLGHTVDIFAYPYGHYNDEVVNAVKSAGYKLARSTHKGIYHTKSDLFTMKGIEVTDDMKRFAIDINN